MKPTPILEELKIAAEATSFFCNDPMDALQVQNGLDLIDGDIVPGINDAIKRHKQLEAVLVEIELWCQIDAKCDVSPTQERRDERVNILKRALKIVRQ